MSTDTVDVNRVPSEQDESFASAIQDQLKSLARPPELDRVVVAGASYTTTQDRDDEVAGATRYSTDRDIVRSATPAVLANFAQIRSSGLSADAQTRLIEIASSNTASGGPYSRVLASTSIGNFLDFWSRVAEYAREPNLTIIPKGRIKALWFRSPQRKLDIQFAENGRAIYSFVNAGRLHEGDGTIQEVIALLNVSGKDVLKKG